MNIQPVDNEHPPRFRVRLDRAEDVPAEVFVPPRRADRGCDHLTLDHVPVPDQTHRSVTRVFKLNSFRMARLHRDRFRNPLQCLNAGHFVGADGVRIALEMQFRSFQIRLAHNLNLSLEHVRILLLCVEPVPAAMRLQRGTAEIPVDLRGRDGFDDSPLRRFVRDFPPGPVSDRPVRVLGRFAGDRDDLRDLLGGEGSRAPRTGCVTEHVFDGMPQRRRRLAALDGDQTLEGLLPSSSPDTDLLSMQIHFRRDVLVQSSLESQENNPAPLNESCGGCGLASDLLQDVELLFRKRNLGCLAGHHFLRPWKILVKTTAPSVGGTGLSREYESGNLQRLGRIPHHKTAPA